MNKSGKLFLGAVLVLLSGGAHPRESPFLSEPREKDTITVIVGGSINKPNAYNLSSPFTVEHAVREAGGLNEFEERRNRIVRVYHKDGGAISVARKKYISFVLQDGDTLWIPRHCW
jgi:protein involved in polysaccharide export with SLBB domain